MKKFLFLFTILFVFTGCMSMDNTPTKKIENLMSKYQTNDKDVLDDLDNVLFNDTSLTDDEREEYRSFMGKHYRDMVYKIKEEKIDGDSATVTVEVTVRDYSDVINEVNEYRLKHYDEFDSDNSFSSYRLKKLKDVTDTETYTIIFHLTKSNDDWEIDPLTGIDEDKINGLYGIRSINSISSGDADKDSEDIQTDAN